MPKNSDESKRNVQQHRKKSMEMISLQKDNKDQPMIGRELDIKHILIKRKLINSLTKLKKMPSVILRRKTLPVHFSINIVVDSADLVEKANKYAENRHWTKCSHVDAFRCIITRDQMSLMGHYFILFSIRCRLSFPLFFSFNNQKQSTDMMPIPVKVRCQLTNYYMYSSFSVLRMTFAVKVCLEAM